MTGLFAAAASASESGEGLKVVIPLIAAAIALFGVLGTLIVNGYRANRERRRELFASGWAVQSYKEMAFAVRRRSSADAAGERVRISEALREIQHDLSFHEAMIGRDPANGVASAYLELVRKTREIAGGIIKRSWDAPPINADDEMHAPEIAAELQALRQFEDAYLDKVTAAMMIWPLGKIGRKRF